VFVKIAFYFQILNVFRHSFVRNDKFYLIVSNTLHYMPYFLTCINIMCHFVIAKLNLVSLWPVFRIGIYFENMVHEFLKQSQTK